MRTIILPQPLATMVVRGLQNSIQSELNDIRYGEKIYVYASKLAKGFPDELDYSRTFHRKAYNEMCLGNLPYDCNELPTESYVGHFRVGNKEGINFDNHRSLKELLVLCPRTFKVGKYNHCASEEELKIAKDKRIEPKRIKREGNTLIVPTGKHFWSRANNLNQCRGLCLFWEDYMNEFGPKLLDMSVDALDYGIEEVEFQYGKRCVRFYAGEGVGQDIAILNDGTYAFIMNFGLDYLIEGTTIVDLPDPRECFKNDAIEQKNKPQKESVEDVLSDLTEDLSEEEPRKFKRPFVRILYTPMGGMTRWKR